MQNRLKKRMRTLLFSFNLYAMLIVMKTYFRFTFIRIIIVINHNRRFLHYFLITLCSDMSDEDIKKKQRKHWKRFKDVMSYLRPWRSSIKRIEGTSPPPPPRHQNVPVHVSLKVILPSLICRVLHYGNVIRQ